MQKEREKLMLDLQRLIESQNFSSDEELRTFMNGMIGQKIPSIPKAKLGVKEQAQDLVYAAYDLPAAKAKANIEKALELDPDCIEAYEFLGAKSRTAELASVSYLKGISIGRRIFGGEYLEEHKGMFWGFHETRPYMRCLHQYAECLYILGNVKKCVAILEEMMELNPNDNQGVRHQLMLYLIQIGEDAKFIKYAEMFAEEGSTFNLFTIALFAFKTEGDSENSQNLLSKALNQNKFVAKRLLSKKPVQSLAGFYSIGDKNEADYYVNFAQQIWGMTKGALVWLKKHSEKS